MVSGFFKEYLDKCLLIQKKDFDVCFQITGDEGSGKSTLGMVALNYLTKGKANMDNIAFSGADAFHKLEKLPDKSTFMLDEAGMSLSSRDWATKEQRRLIRVFQTIRQKNMILILISPSFFEINKYFSCHRTKFLFLTYVRENFKRGNFAIFGESKLRTLYHHGKKYNSYSFPKTNIRSSFPKFIPPYQKEYLREKSNSLQELFGGKKKEFSQDEKKQFIIRCLKNIKEKEIELRIIDLLGLFGISKPTYYSYLQETPQKTPIQRESVQK